MNETGESFPVDYDALFVEFDEVIEGVKVTVKKGPTTSTLFFSDGTISTLSDNGRSVTHHPDGGLTVVDPQDNFYSYETGEKIDIAATSIEQKLRNTYGWID